MVQKVLKGPRGATLRNGREIQCLPSAGFSLQCHCKLRLRMIMCLVVPNSETETMSQCSKTKTEADFVFSILTM